MLKATSTYACGTPLLIFLIHLTSFKFTETDRHMLFHSLNASSR